MTRKQAWLHFGVWFDKEDKKLSVADMDAQHIWNICKMLNLTLKEIIDFFRILESYNKEAFDSIYNSLVDKGYFNDNIALYDAYIARVEELKARQESNTEE